MNAEIDYRNEFKKDAQAYDRIVQSKHIRLIYRLEKEVLRDVFSRLPCQDPKVMDFACGSGRWTRVLETLSDRTLGVDVSPQMISRAKETCRMTEFVVTDITSEQVSDALCGRKFNVITAFRFYKNAQDALRQSVTDALPTYLEEEGLFVFDLHLNTHSFMGLLANLMRLLQFPRLFGMSELLIRTMSMADVKRLFADSAFEVVDYYGMGFLPGRSNTVLLPQKWLYSLEAFFTRRQLFRRLSYTLLIIAKKRNHASERVP